MNKLTEIKSFKDILFDDKQMQYFTHYFSEYYHDQFRPNQGTEVILHVLKESGAHDTWLDVGAGPATMFWGLLLESVHTLHCTEMHIEGLYVLDNFIQSGAIPQCYRDVMNIYSISLEHLDTLRKLPRKNYLFDALQPWPTELGNEKYDLITAFGVFGLSKTPDEYKKCFGYPKPFLAPGGIGIGANWIRSQYYIDNNGGDNRYMDASLIEEAATTYGYQIAHLSRERIHDDPNYDAVLVWALKK